MREMDDMSDSMLAAAAMVRTLNPRVAAPQGAWDGISVEGLLRIREVLQSVAMMTPQEAFGYRQELRFILGMVPARSDLPARVGALLANDRWCIDDVLSLLEDRKGEVPLANLRLLVADIRDGMSAQQAANTHGCSVSTVYKLSRFLGVEEHRLDTVRDAAYSWAYEQVAFDVFLRDSGLPMPAAELEWRTQLEKRGPLTEPQRALLDGESMAGAFQQALGIESRSTAWRLLSEARKVVIEVEGLAL